jgi:hypothetical protein
MTPRKQERKQKTQPKGKDKRTGGPADPIEIPVPKRKQFEDLLKRAALRGTSSSK